MIVKSGGGCPREQKYTCAVSFVFGLSVLPVRMFEMSALLFYSQDPKPSDEEVRRVEEERIQVLNNVEEVEQKIKELDNQVEESAREVRTENEKTEFVRVIFLFPSGWVPYQVEVEQALVEAEMESEVAGLQQEKDALEALHAKMSDMETKSQQERQKVSESG